MDIPKTPRRVLRNLNIQDTPKLNVLGYGTGVRVFSLKRSPIGSKALSPWAIKRVNKQSKNTIYEDRLKREAEMLKNLNHPNIVGFRGFTKSEDGRDVLVMEDCDASLGDIIEQRRESDLKPFPPNEIILVIRDIAQALHYLHEEKHLLHCDIKSFNILIKGDFKIAKLCDFGSTVPLDYKGNMKRGYNFEGTELWMAAECFDENNTITTKADIFPLGLVLWEMITLQVPFMDMDMSCATDTSFMDLSNIPYGTRPEWPADIPTEYNQFIDIFNQCTEIDPCKRPSTKELVDLLNKI